ncbi:enhancer of split mgamma protein-like isoform X2 [Ceratina calcarata]|nr:enhancer of split mgamma protein-like isoform X2 [Ceratina calcarata]
MIDALETEGEDINKLEKADILELTVRHLQRLQGSQASSGFTRTASDEISAEARWISGFGHCAAEAYRFLSALPGEGAEKLARHLAAGLQKSYRTNSTLKTNLLTQILASLDLTTDPLASSILNANINSAEATDQNPTMHNETICERVAVDIDETISADNRKDLSACASETKDFKEGQIAKKVKAEIKIEDDEEIDVERVDEADPMWRPW